MCRRGLALDTFSVVEDGKNKRGAKELEGGREREGRVCRRNGNPPLSGGREKKNFVPLHPWGDSDCNDWVEGKNQPKGKEEKGAQKKRRRGVNGEQETKAF